MARRLGCRFTTDAADFLDSAMDLVVEVAGHDALHSYAEAVLRADKDLMVVAVGAFADARPLGARLASGSRPRSSGLHTVRAPLPASI